MTIEALKSDLSQKFPVGAFSYETLFGSSVINAPANEIFNVLSHLKNQLGYDFLMQVSGADYPNRQKRFDVIYELFSTKTFNRVRVKSQVGEGESIESACRLWKTANWFERETYDMYGIIFRNHPNLTRILVHHEFVGHPLRKDYDANKQQHCRTSQPIFFQDEPNYKPDPNKNLLPLNTICSKALNTTLDISPL